MLQDGDRKVVFKGSVRECICKLAALTDATGATNSVGIGYSEEDMWAENFQVTQCYGNEGTFLRFELAPTVRPTGY